MIYGDVRAEGRALGWAGSILFGIGLAIWGSLVYLVRRFLQGIREGAATNWQTASAQITTGNVNVVHGRFVDYALATIGYAYYVEGAYYSGYLTRQFWDEQRAWSFVDGCRDKPVLVHHRFDKPQNSVLLQPDLAACTPVTALRPRPASLNPLVAILWSLRDLDWIAKKLQDRAASWPSVPATVEYAEAMIAGDDNTTRWVGDLHFSYSVDGNTYSNSHYFRASDEEEARESVQAWRNRRIIVHYLPGNPARAVFIPQEQDTADRTQV